MKRHADPNPYSKFVVYKQPHNVGFGVKDLKSNKMLARFDRKSWFNMDTELYGFPVEINKVARNSRFYRVRVANMMIRLEFNKFGRPYFYVHGKRFQWKMRRFLFFRQPMRLYHGGRLIAKYTTVVFSRKRLGVLTLYQTCSEFDKAIFIAVCLCLVHRYQRNK